MSPIRNARVIFNSIPTGYPEPGKTVVYDDSQTIDVEKAPLNGGFLVKTLVLSIDPYMRGRMRPPEVESYASAWIIGEPCNGYGVGVVVRSECNNVKAGDHVYGPSFQHQEYFVMKSLDERTRILENKEDLPWYVYVGAAGMPGKTAFAGWKEYSKAKKGDIVFVTAGGGPVGLMVIQLAKKDGLKVIASAGSQEKIDLMKQAGADVTFNYKTTSTEEVLQKEGPVNIYWDNVGGETLDAALKHAAFFARFIECGMISGYNQRPKPIENIDSVFTRSISMNGFIVWNLELKYDDEFYRTVPPKLASGEFKHREEVFKGLDKVGDVILLGQKGLNKAKTVVLVAEE